jgi:hypothetical protein
LVFHPKQSGSQQRTAVKCGGHKHPRHGDTRKQPQRSKGASNIRKWQATEKQPRNTEQTGKQYSKATQTVIGDAETKPHKQTTSSSTTQAETTQQKTLSHHAEHATQSAAQSTSTTKQPNANKLETKR